MRYSEFRYIILPLLIICLCACAKKTPPSPEDLAAQSVLADMREFPQNLEIYAKNAGADRRLLSSARQEEMSAGFINTWFGPWHMSRTTISRREMGAALKRPWGFQRDGTPWTSAQWDQIRYNAAPERFPSKASPGITLRATNLREAPTHGQRFAKSDEKSRSEPFDTIQYSALPPGMPLLITHTSRDGGWHYIECPIAGGWVPANDAIAVDAAFRQLWQTGEYAALTRDNVILPGTGKNGGDSLAGIGAILPLAGKTSTSLKVLAPVRDKTAQAAIAEITIPTADAAIMPLPLTPANVAAVGNKLMGQAYGWGGMNGLRDCSAMLRDLFAPFGIWLPRNSAAQARRGSVISLAGMSMREKENAILKDGVPFLSLVGLPGHITLYVGPWKNRPALFHNAWGLRIVKNGDDDERFIIGKAVVTSISPGMELPNLYRPKTFTDRIRSLSTPGH